MRQPWIVCCLLILSLCAQPRDAGAQTNGAAAESAEAYKLKVAVDEVSLTFHADDGHGLPVNDLKLYEFSLLDNGKPPRRILEFRPLQDMSLRAGILIDTSDSMRQNVAANRAISIRFAQQLPRQQSDQAFVMDFGYVSQVTQTWTRDRAVLAAGIRQVVAGRENPLGGTAMLDAIFRACFNIFGKVDHAASGNFILLFSDGDDNASHTSVEEVVDMCQRSNTAIYVFRAEPVPSFFSFGPKTLAELATKTGGRVFAGDDSEAGIDSDLRTIEADLRNQYRLIYNPVELRHDGAFHHIQLKTPERVESVSIRSGYYDLPR
jgi:VWFA-related protein